LDAVGPFRGRVRQPDCRPGAGGVERARNARTGEARVLGGRADEDVARVQRAMSLPRRPRVVDRAGHRAQNRERARKRHDAELPERDVKRFAGHVFEHREWRRPFEAGVEDRHERRVRGGARGAAERVAERGGGFGNEIEPERLDRDESIVIGIVGAKNRSQGAAANLVQDAIRAEGGRRAHARGIIKRQRTRSLRSGNRNTAVVD
jgi:hypothetical protein